MREIERKKMLNIEWKYKKALADGHQLDDGVWVHFYLSFCEVSNPLAMKI